MNYDFLDIFLFSSNFTKCYSCSINCIIMPKNQQAPISLFLSFSLSVVDLRKNRITYFYQGDNENARGGVIKAVLFNGMNA